ncbi:GlsB/YeaQ/YmgE family stress response membrane protein [Qipengyuania marisflavi]|uniref:GlsB/YeaQ/YmgE family stress response membrane protein n=1 Tax=Qipengyuania marisflavi TaxID=2486356 RepID=A0A5S3P5P0_9SPHN|nr:GlsB/YeaQ/YmgE family stress response membrane protein [Qipengyuania marisflavi]TMM48359.1 GlsB/YeaQ/YmgE family stress response membrane protein [Qipengyuania marisflavi]
MGLIILIVVGAVLGWLATFILKIEDGREIMANIAVGSLGSLLVGLIASNGTFFSSLSATALLWATLGAAGGIGILYFVRQRAYQ